MSSETAVTEISQRETLLLIAHYLRSLPVDKHALDQLQQSLTDNGLLGEVPTWEGGSRRATIDDMLRLNQQLPSNHLLKCLQLATQSGSSAEAGGGTASLLRAASNPDPALLQAKLRTYVDKLSEVHEIQTQQRELTRRQAEVTSRLASVGSDSTELQSTGLARELDRVETELGKLDAHLVVATEELHSTVAWLRAAGHILTSLHRPRIDSTPAAIMQREYFGSRLGGAHTDHRLCRSGLSSVDGVDFRLKYRKLFMVHGHIFNPAYCVIFDHTGRYVISGSDDFLIKIWDVQSGLQARVLKGHTSHISYLAISPDNAMLASASTDCTVRLWRIKDGYPLARLWHDAAVNWVKFDPVTGGLASAADDGTCKVWDVANLLQDELQGLPLLELAASDDQLTTPQQSRPAIVGWHSTPDELATGRSGLSAIEEREATAAIRPQEDTGASSSTARPVTPMQASSPMMGQAESSVHPRHRTRSTDPPAAAAVVQPQRLADALPDPDVQGVTSYEWTRMHGNMLLLPHTNPAAQAQGEDRITRVMCVDFSPLGGLFVTGSDDALGRVWQTRSNAWNKLNVTDFGDVSGSRPATRHSARREPDSFLVCKLQGHLSSVTDVRFSHLGDRILTASQNDGTVRIWTFARNFSQLNHIVLHLNADADEFDDGQPMSGRNRASRRRKQIEVYNVAWTSDDRWVLTLQSFPRTHEPGHSSSREVDARLKVWDSFSGVLQHTIEVAHARCVVLAPHPNNPSIVATGGEDGVISLWNVFKEECLLRHSMFHTGPERFGYVEGDPIAAVDGAFSPDGSRFCISDKFGRVTVFGLEDAERYKHNPEEQLFSSDYQEVLIDNDGRVIDPGTNLPAYVAPTGALINFAGAAYDPQPPRPLTPGPLSLRAVQAERLGKLQDAKKLEKAMQEAYIYSARARSRAGRESSRLLSQAGNGAKSRVARAAGATTRHRPTNRFATMSDLQTRVDFVIDDDSHDMDAFSSGSELDWGEHPQHTHNLRQRAAATRPRGHGRMTRTSRRAEEEWAEFQAELSQPRRNLRRAARSTGRVIEDSSELDEEEDPELVVALAESQRAQPSTSSRSRRTAAPRRVRDVTLPTICEFGDSVSREWLLVTEQSPVEYVPQLGDIVMYLPQGHLEHLSMFPETTAPPWQSFPRKWPIVVCKVVGLAYDFPSAEVFQRSDSTVCHIELQLLKFPPDLDRDCQFLRDYLPRQGRLVRDDSSTFRVSLHRASLAEFLVLHHMFERSALYPWEAGSRFVAEFVEYTPEGEKVIRAYNGHVEGISDENPRDWPHSPWELFEVSWDGPESETGYNRISPWEAKPVTSGPLHEKIESVTGPQLDDALRQKLLHAIRRVSETPAAQPFLEPVPMEVPLYHKQIPLPMDLGTIAARLESRYYRQVEAYQHDVKLIVENCRTFNVEDSPIVHAAVEITSTLLDAVTSDEPLEAEETGGDAARRRSLRRQRSSSSSRARRSSQEEEDEQDEEVETETARHGRGMRSSSSVRVHREGAAQPRRMSQADGPHESGSEDENEDEESDAFEQSSERSASDSSSDSEDSSDSDSDDETGGSRTRRASSSAAARRKKSKRRRESPRRSKRRRTSTRRKWGDDADSDDDHNDEGADDDHDADGFDEQASSRRRSKSRRLDQRANGKRPARLPISVSRETDRENISDGATAAAASASRRSSSRRRSFASYDVAESSETSRTSAAAAAASQRGSRGAPRAIAAVSEDVEDEGSPPSAARPRRSVKRSRWYGEEASEEDPAQEPSRRSSRTRTPSAAALLAAAEATPASSSSSTSTRRARTREELQKMQALLEYIAEIDAHGLFAEPVTEEIAPRYFEIVAEPMDRQLIEVNLATNVYNSVQDMIAHCELMYNNCLEYNDSKSSIAKEARRQQKLMRDFIRRL